MATIGNRLDRLEAATRPELPGKGYLCVYMDPDQEGVYWEKYPFSEDKGRQFNQADLDEHHPVIKVQFVKGWRVGNEANNK